MDSDTVIDELIDMLEQPYKFVENSYWQLSTLRCAAEQNCSVLLDGQFGNLTVSLGTVEQQLYDHFLRLKWIKLAKDINCYCKNKRISRKKIY